MSKITFGKWYTEYKTHSRIHDYCNIMVNQFPIIVYRRTDFNLHEDMETVYSIGLFGFSFSYE